MVSADKLIHGYGIYWVPLSRKEDKENRVPFNIDNLENFYKLNPEIKVSNLTSYEKGKNLLLVYTFEGKSYCSIIDGKTGKEVQNILLDEKNFKLWKKQGI